MIDEPASVRARPEEKRSPMKFLLTSSGIRNPSIADALDRAGSGKPVSESRALFVPTGVYPFPGGAASAWEAITGKEGPR